MLLHRGRRSRVKDFCVNGNQRRAIDVAPIEMTGEIGVIEFVAKISAAAKTVNAWSSNFAAQKNEMRRSKAGAGSGELIGATDGAASETTGRAFASAPILVMISCTGVAQLYSSGAIRARLRSPLAFGSRGFRDLLHLRQMVQIMPGEHVHQMADALFAAFLVHAVVLP